MEQGVERRRNGEGVCVCECVLGGGDNSGAVKSEESYFTVAMHKNLAYS